MPENLIGKLLTNDLAQASLKTAKNNFFFSNEIVFVSRS